MKLKIVLSSILILGVIASTQAKSSLISNFLDNLNINNTKTYNMTSNEDNVKVLMILSDLEMHDYIKEIEYYESPRDGNMMMVSSKYVIPKENQEKVKDFIMQLGLDTEDFGKEDKTLKINFILGRSARFELV